MKSSYYVATVVRAYRKAIDEYYVDPKNYKLDREWLEEVKKVSHREFTTGFYFNKPDHRGQVYETSSYIRDYVFVGLIKEYDIKTGIATVEQRNKMSVGDEIEIIGPEKRVFKQRIERMWNEEGIEIDSAPHPQQLVWVPVPRPLKPYDLVRRIRVEGQDI